MKLKAILSQYGKELFLTALSLLNLEAVTAQVSLDNLTPYNQDFNTLTQSAAGTTWTDNSTLAGWYAENGPSTTIKASYGADLTDGLKSYGSSGDSDRALGCVKSTPGDFNYGLRLKNNTGKIIRDLNVSYRLENWRVSNNHKTDFEFSYRKASAVTSITTGTWESISALGVALDKGTSTGPVDGNASPNYYTVSALITNLELANGEEIMLRWSNTHSSKAIYMGIDDIIITPLNTERVFYNRPTGNLHSTSTWTVNADGSAGTEPTSFTASYQRFVLVNNATPTLNANWAVSGQESKVVIGNGVTAIHFTIPATFTFTGTIDVENNATLTVNNSALPNLGSLGATSTVIYNSALNQNLTTGEYGNLVITGAGAKKLGADTRVNTRLTLSNRNLELQNFDLELAAGAIITGADSLSYIVTKGTGRLRQQVQNNDTPVAFPVGTDVYAPVQLKQAVTAETDFFSVKALDGIYDYYINNEPVGDAFTSKTVSQTWIVDEAVIGGSDLTMSVSWKRNTATSDFDLSTARLNHFKSGAWDNSTPVSYLKSGSYFELSRSGITSFSPFGVFSGNFGGGPATLPVNLISFKANREKDRISCHWETAQEYNNDHFAVERSLDGKNFMQVGLVKGNGTTNQLSRYSFQDENAPLASVFYRLRQTDSDGTTVYSSISMVAAAKVLAPALTLYPNPGVGERLITGRINATEKTTITVSDIKGNIIHSQSAHPDLFKAGLPLNLKDLPAGYYLIRVVTDAEILSIRMVQAN